MLNRGSLIRLILCVVVIAEAIFLGSPIRALATSTSYYVSPSGSDSNDGTSPATAWQTIDKVSGTTFEAGDQILFEGGQSFSGSLYFDATDGASAQSPITISSYGTGRATINAGNNDAFFIYNSAGYNINNLNLVGSGAGTNNGSGISTYADLGGDVKLDHLNIDQVEASGFDNGIVIGAWNNSTGYKNVNITHVSTHNNRLGGISTYSQVAAANENVYVGYSSAYQNLGNPTLTYNSGSGIILGGVNGGTIEYSSAYSNGSLCTANECGVGIWTYNSNNVTIQFNESYSNKTGSAVDGGGFDLDGGVTNSLLQYNFSHDNDGAGVGLFQYNGAPTWQNNVIRFNVSQNDGRKSGQGGIAIWNGGNGIGNAQIYNNTIFMSPAGTKGSARAITFLTPSTNFKFYNNNFITTGGAKLIDATGTQTGASFIGNSYWPSGGAFALKWGTTTYNSLATWRTATGQEIYNSVNTGFSVNPQVANPGGATTIGDPTQLATMTAYKLLASSPLINQGQDLNNFGINPGGHDFWSTVIPQGSAIDVGANEYVNSSTPTPTPSNTPTPTPSPTPTASPSSTPTPTPTPTGDTQAPTVNITSPTEGSIVPKSSVVTIQATASDNTGVTKVEFYVANKLKCTDNSAPYDCAWSVPNTPNTSYVLKAKAFDAANNTTTHQVNVTSSN